MKPELTIREMDVLYLLSNGYTAREVSSRLGLSIHTVRTYSKTIISKLGARNITHAVAIFIKNEQEEF